MNFFYRWLQLYAGRAEAPMPLAPTHAAERSRCRSLLLEPQGNTFAPHYLSPSGVLCEESRMERNVRVEWRNLIGSG